jgi:hypothetical protein
MEGRKQRTGSGKGGEDTTSPTHDTWTMWEQDTCISNIGKTPTTKKDIIPHKKIKERTAHNNCLHKTSNNNRRKTKASTAHSSIITTLMD